MAIGCRELSLCSQVTVAGMHARGKPLLLGDAPAQVSQLYPFFFAEGGAKALLVLCGNPGKLTQHLASLRCEVQFVIAAILRATAPLDDAFGFEFIDQQHHAAGHYPKMFRQRLLADAGIGGNLSQQPRIGSCQPNLRHAFGKTTPPVSADLG